MAANTPKKAIARWLMAALLFAALLALLNWLDWPGTPYQP